MARHILPALAMALAACYGPDVPIGAPCLEDADCPLGQSCNPELDRCEPPSELLAWRDDTAADFGAEGASFGGVTIEPGGFVGPVAYFAGGLRLTGINKNVIPNDATPWAEIEDEPRSGTSFERRLLLDFGLGAPVGLGLSGADGVTVLVEGEIYLGEAGRWRFRLNASDIGFLELAAPGGAAFQRVVTDQNERDSDGYYQVAAPGWHRLRGAFADAIGDMVYELRYDGPGNGGLQSIPFHDLRAPASDVAGYIVDGFEDAFLLGPDGSVVDAEPLANRSYGTSPLGLDVGTNAYSLRYAAQVLIDVAGDYSFKIVSNQGHRAWLNGASIADRFGTTASETSVTMPKTLEPGWHDLVIDVHKNSTNNNEQARLDVTVQSGPVWVGQAIPIDHLRPIVGRATRWAGGFTDSDSDILDTGVQLNRPVTFDVPVGMVTTRIDAAFQVSHPAQAQLDIKLNQPNGTTATLVSPGSLTGNGSYRAYLERPVGTAGKSWTFTARDAVPGDGMAGTFSFAAVTLTGTAGPAPFETGYYYVSAPRDLGENLASITHVKWGLRQAKEDTMVTVSLRTCDTAAACESQEWTPVIDGAMPAVPVRRFAQYLIAVIGNGDVPTALDWMEIGYRAYID